VIKKGLVVAKKKAAKKVAPKAKSGKKSGSKSKAKPSAKKSKAAPKAKPKAKAKSKVVAKKATVKKSAPKVAAKKSSAKTSAPKAMKTTAKTSTAKSTVKAILDLSNFVSPLDDRLMIQLAGAEKMTAGGLFIPDTVSDVSGNLQGHVVAVGRGHMDKKGRIHPLDVQVGDKVVFAEYAGSKIKIQNEDLVIIRESEVMGVVSK
jgi:chaperonin GroES